MGDQSAYFAVDVTLTGESGKTYLTSYSVSGGSHNENPTVIAIGVTTTFYLKHEETITILNLPYGVTYTVVEKDYTTEANGGYDEASYTWSDEEGKKIDTATDTVQITNNKGTTVDTGIILDNMPYILLLAVVCVGMFAFINKKRMMED